MTENLVSYRQAEMFIEEQLLLTGSARRMFLQIAQNRPDHDTPEDLYIHGVLILPHPLGWQWTMCHHIAHNDFAWMSLDYVVATYAQCVAGARKHRDWWLADCLRRQNDMLAVQ